MACVCMSLFVDMSVCVYVYLLLHVCVCVCVCVCVVSLWWVCVCGVFECGAVCELLVDFPGVSGWCIERVEASSV